MGKGPSDEDLIKGALGTWKSALAAKNLDQLMGLYSETYKDGEGRGKAEMKSFVADAISQGYLDEVKVDMDSVETTIESGKATTGPVYISSAAGSMTLSMAWAKEGDAWKIVGVDAY